MDQGIQEIVENYNNYLDILNVNILPLSEKLREGDIADSLEKITFLFEGMEWILTVNKALSELNYLNKVDQEAINKILKEITIALENKDYYLSADLLEYELFEVIEKMEKYNIN